MRFIFTILIALTIFTANQVAMAYEHCDDAHCAFFMGDEHKQEKKADTGADHHCCGGTVLHLSAVKQPSADVSDKTEWNLAQGFTSVSPPTLIEPPTSL
ncbi:MAG: hypothetical protein J0M34_05250 [Alphaproteobacteria bacterium]|nr:hypothetical protein [Alphaproteobacteria bacterium]